MECITDAQCFDIGHQLKSQVFHHTADQLEFLNFRKDANSLLEVSSQSNRLQIVLGIIVRLVVPLYNGVARGWQEIRALNAIQILRNLQASRSLITSLLALAANSISMSLSSVQCAAKITPLLKLVKFRNESIEYLPHQAPDLTANLQQFFHPAVEKCVSVEVVSEPEPGSSIRADIIFIHGLHGSLVKTWKQGLWNSESRRVIFERPPKPPVRPPKRPRHTRTSLYHPQHLSKRPRFCQITSRSGDECSTDFIAVENNGSIDYTYDCDEVLTDDVLQQLDNFYTFSTFRSRLDNYGDNEDKHVPDNFSSSHSNSSSSSSSSNNEKDENSLSKSENYSKCWPGDWLPIDCPGVRIITVNYTTDPYLWRPMWIRKRNRSSLAERSREMMDLLIKLGVGFGHPIVWVGHSKGGLYIKQIIVDSWECGKETYAPLWKSSRGVLFYSVPHRGSQLADFHLPFLKRSIELMEIQKNCPGVLELHRRFVALYRSGYLKVQVFSFVETALTFMSVLYLKIVGIDSADPGIGEVCGIHLDHRQICKPRSRECILYTELAKMINNIS